MTEYLDQLSNLTVEQAGALLATTAVVNRRVREKTALDLNEIMKNVTEAKTPGWESVRNGLIGAGVGAGAGALSSLSQPRERRRSLSTMAQGALLGGLAGGGGTLAFRHFNQLQQTPDSAVEPRIGEIEQTLRRNAVRGIPADMSEPLQKELDTLNTRLKAMQEAEAAGTGGGGGGEAVAAEPEKPLGPASLAERLPVALDDLASGHPVEAARTFAPNATGGVIGAGVGGVTGYGAGKATEMGVNRLYLGNRVANMKVDDLKKVLDPAVAQAVHTEANAAPKGLFTGRRALPASAKQFKPALRANAPRIGSKFLPRAGGIGGAILGAGLGGGMGEGDYAATEPFQQVVKTK